MLLQLRLRLRILPRIDKPIEKDLLQENLKKEKKKKKVQINSSSGTCGIQSNRNAHTNSIGSTNTSPLNANADSNNATTVNVNSKPRTGNTYSAYSTNAARNEGNRNAADSLSNGNATNMFSSPSSSYNFGDTTSSRLGGSSYNFLGSSNGNSGSGGAFSSLGGLPNIHALHNFAANALSPLSNMFGGGQALNASTTATGTPITPNTNQNNTSSTATGAPSTHTSNANANTSTSPTTNFTSLNEPFGNNTSTNSRRYSGNSDSFQNSNMFRAGRSFHPGISGYSGFPLNTRYVSGSAFPGSGGFGMNRTYAGTGNYAFGLGNYSTSGTFTQGGGSNGGVGVSLFGPGGEFSATGSRTNFNQTSPYSTTNRFSSSTSALNSNTGNYSSGINNNSSRVARTSGSSATVGATSTFLGNNSTGANATTNLNNDRGLDSPSGLDNPDGPTGLSGNDYDPPNELRQNQNGSVGNNVSNFTFGKNSGNKRNYAINSGNSHGSNGQGQSQAHGDNNNGNHGNANNSPNHGYSNGTTVGNWRNYDTIYGSGNGQSSSLEKGKNGEGSHGCNITADGEKDRKQYIESLNMEERKKEAEKYRRLGNQSYKLGFFQSAIDYYTKAIEYDNTNHVYYTNRALCYKKQKLWKQANSDARQALNLEEESVKAHFILGLTLLHLNSLEEGLKKLTKAKTLSSYLKDSNESEINRYILQAKKLIYLRDEQTKQLMYAELKSFLIDKINTLYESGDIDKSEKDLRISQTETLFNDALQSTQDKTVPDYLCCKISMCLMDEPVITPSGMTYDKMFLTEHVKYNGPYDPVSRQTFTMKDVIPNYAIKEATEQFLKANPWAFEE